MNKIYPNEIKVASNKKIHRKRNEIAAKIVDFENNSQKQSQRTFAKNKNIPRTTLQHWLERKKNIDALPELIDFCESPVGIAFLHRIITAAHFAFTEDGVASIHNVSTFLELSGISSFIASSYTTQNRVSKKMDEHIIEFEEFVSPELCKKMPSKKITLAEDETFHPQICMVSIEPRSNFIIVEKYVENREGKTWNQVVNQALKDLPVEVIQVTSDEGRGLINHTTKGLKAHHSPDCFHVPHEIGKGTSGALASAVKKAEKEYETALKQAQKEINLKEKFDQKTKRPVGRPPSFEKKIELANEKEQEANSNLETARQNQESVRDAKAKIGTVYHPYDLKTGDKQDSKKVAALLESCFEKIDEATKQLSDRCKKRVDKAHRVVSSMVATIAFYFRMIELYMDNMHMTDQDRQLMHTYLIPGLYLRAVALKEKETDRKAEINEKSEELLSILTQENGPFSKYTDKEIKNLVEAAEECVYLFQRSSSCVEGRNAQLSLRHHGIHRLSDLSLKAQTIVHNYYRRNCDGTTPAERFFNAKHIDLFEWLLDKMDYPARPRNVLRRAA